MGMTRHKLLVKELNKMRKIIYSGTDAEKQAYSDMVLLDEESIMDLYVADEMGFDVEEHIRKYLESNDSGFVELALEYCYENKFLDEKTKYDLVIELYEKLLSFNSYPTIIKATRLLEKNSFYSEYLKRKPSSDYYIKILNEKIERKREDESLTKRRGR